MPVRGIEEAAAVIKYDVRDRGFTAAAAITGDGGHRERFGFHCPSVV